MARESISIFLMRLLLWCCLTASAKAEYMKYKDPKQPLLVRIQDLLDRMTLEEKIGQMVQIDCSVASAEVMKKYFIGSILSGGGSVPAPQASAEAWIKMINDFQKGCLSTRLGIPMIYGIDAVHGNNNVYKATIFPHNIGLGATRDPELVKKIGAATALEARATGIPYVFAPCIAVCRDPRWGRCYESYSEDPQIVQAMTEIVPGLQGDIPASSPKGVPFVAGKTKVAACAKHYVGDGGTTNGINENNSVIDRHGLLSIHMPGYYTSIIKGVSTVMVSYSSWNGIKMHANRDLVTGFLKNTLRFRGFVISDWEGLDRITSPPHANYSYSIQAGIHAGIDVVMVPYNYTEFINGLTFQVKNNIIPMSRIDDAVKRILRVKFVMGLFENPLADDSLVDQLGSQEHRELAREAVRRSLVLLKNGQSANHPLLPLPKTASKILVAGSHADNLGYQCGGWTIEWQGLSGNNLTIGTTILTAIKNTVDSSTDVVYKENPDTEFVKSNNFSYAIVVVGEHPYAETDGDSMNLTILDPGPSAITNVCGVVKCVVIIISGRPVVIQPYVDSIDALVAAWLPGTEGQGVADVLFGDYGFTASLNLIHLSTMNDLLTESFEIPRGQGSRGGDIELGAQMNSGELGLQNFFKKVLEIDKQYEQLDKLLKKLQGAHKESMAVTKAPAMKSIKQRMEKDVDEVGKVSRFIKGKIEELDRENLANRQKPGCGKGTGVDRSRTATTLAVKKKLKDKMAEFQTLRETIHQEHREVVERRVFTVTGTRPDEETIEKLIDTGDSEQIFQKAIQEQGRGRIMDTVSEIHERHEAVRDLERKLLELQQVFLDMAVLVDAQGDMLDNIESHVSTAVDHVQSGNTALQKAKKLQKNSRKWMCIAIIILLIIVVIIVVAVIKPWSSNKGA